MPDLRLVVTNGRSAAQAIRRAGIQFTSVISWDDVLHEGPIRDHRQDSAFRRERSAYLARRGYGDAQQILSDLALRDEAFDRGLTEVDEVVLWFEHDLYDQLQLLQVLSRIARREIAATVSIVNRELFLAEAEPRELADSFEARLPAGAEVFDQAVRVWSDVTSPTPEPMVSLMGRSALDSMPFMLNAIHRLLQELPEPSTGLSRSQRQVLKALVREPLRPAALFHRCAEMEEAKFMGDWSFWAVLSDLGSGVNRLIASPGGGLPASAMEPDSCFFDSDLALTANGRDVLEGTRSAIDFIGLDRWVGGTRLHRRSYWTFTDSEPSGLGVRNGTISRGGIISPGAT